MPVLREDTYLYLVPTPIGNLDDITIRSINVLKEVDVILAEDTRTTGILLKHHNINNKLQSYHAFNEHKVLGNLIDRLKKGERIAVVTDAGTPGISDPGFLLVRECIRNNIKVESLPGATAFVPALVKSGLPSDTFIFEGFLPQKKGRQTKLQQICREERTVILYESPYRLIKTLEDISTHCGPERIVSVSREISKLHEETITGPVLQVIQYYNEKGVKGEIVVILQGNQNVKEM